MPCFKISFSTDVAIDLSPPSPLPNTSAFKKERWHLKAQNTVMQIHCLPPTASKIKVCVTIWAWRNRCSEEAGDTRAIIKGSLLRDKKGEQKCVSRRKLEPWFYCTELNFHSDPNIKE